MATITTRKRHVLPLIPVFLYIPLLVIPWVLTCVLVYRPLGLPSYINQAGEYGNLHDEVARWLQVLRAFSAIGVVATLPVISALLAQAAVVYAQRQSAKTLRLEQVLALADRGWANLATLFSPFPKYGEQSARSLYLWLAAVLFLLSAAQAIVQQILVSTGSVTVMTCHDNPLFNLNKDCDHEYPLGQVVAYDPEPFALAGAPQDVVVRNLVGKLAAVSLQDPQLHLWPELSDLNLEIDNNVYASQLQFYSDFGGPAKFFVSAVPNNTHTGILREHAMRMNSSAVCTSIDSSAFPTVCPGSQPFVTSYNRNAQSEPESILMIDICAPGDFTATPWTLSRSRQDISEDLYMRVQGTSFGGNFTVQCAANTTRGYFELPNINNNFMRGPLITTWPSPETLFKNFNDYFPAGAGVQFDQSNLSSAIPIPQLGNNDSYTTTGFTEWQQELTLFPPSNEVNPPPTPGPLMSSALAMFGNDSFFHLVTNATLNPNPVSALCEANSVPFMRVSGLGLQRSIGLCDEYINWAPASVLSSQIFDINQNVLYPFMNTFNDTQTSRSVLQMALFLAAESYLTETVAATTTSSARAIYRSPGTVVPRPEISLAGIIVVSVLIALEVCGIVFLLVYILLSPTWTARLDSLAIAQIAVSTVEVGDGVVRSAPSTVVAAGVEEASATELKRVQASAQPIGEPSAPATPTQTQQQQESLLQPQQQPESIVVARDAAPFLLRRLKRPVWFPQGNP